MNRLWSKILHYAHSPRPRLSLQQPILPNARRFGQIPSRQFSLQSIRASAPTSYYSKSPILTTLIKPGITRQVIFGTSFILFTTLFAAAYTNIDVEERVEELNKNAIWRFGRPIADVDLEKDRRMELVRGTKASLEEIRTVVGGEIRLPLILAEGWINLTESQRTMGGIILLNSIVFLAWQIRR